MKVKIYFYYHGADILGGPRSYSYEAEIVCDKDIEKTVKDMFFTKLDPWKRSSVYEVEVVDEIYNHLWEWSEEKATKRTIEKYGWKLVRQKARPFIPLKLVEGKWVRNGPPYVPDKR